MFDSKFLTMSFNHFKFDLNEDAFLVSDNSKVRVLEQQHSTIEEPSYLILHLTGNKFQVNERELAKTADTFENANFRVGDLVYFRPSRFEKDLKVFTITKIYLHSIDNTIVYVCQDKNGENFYPPVEYLSFYQKSLVTR